MEWGDRLAAWFLAERDTRGWVEDHGWAHAVGHGADALGTLASYSHLDRDELQVVLDVLGTRVLRPSRTPADLRLAGEPDRLASATMAVLRRDLVGLDHLEIWVQRLVESSPWTVPHHGGDPYLAGGNLEALLRALHLQMVPSPEPPAVCPDLLLVLVDALRTTNPHTSRLPAPAARR